jgi:hypothetical protein
MARGSRRPSRASVRCLSGLAAFAFACAPQDLPNDQVLTSAHFRYHARAETVLDPTIMDRLETHRAEFDTWFGVESGLVDYYLFRDDHDFLANAPCPGHSCTSGSSVFTTAPVHEHELVHGFLADVGQPAEILGEGIAQHAACIQTHIATQIPPASWPQVAGGSNTNDTDIYNFGQRLTAWMLAARGPAAFISFYGKSLRTHDPALFALQFEDFWGRRLGDVAVELNDDRYEGSSCPCGAPAVPDDGSPISFVAQQDYRTFDVAEESRVQLGSDGPLVYPASCVNAADEGADSVPAASAALTVARVGAGRFGVIAWPGADGTTVTVRRTQQPQRDWSCEAALKAPVAVGAGDVALWVTPDLASDANGTWFAVDVDGPRVLSMLSLDGLAIVCTSSCDHCGLGGAALAGPVVTPGGIVKVHLLTGLFSSDLFSHASVGVLLSHPTP